MADYTEEQRVKQRWPNARLRRTPTGVRVEVFREDIYEQYGWLRFDGLSKRLPTEAEAWADASRRLGNEFVDEVGPLAERKEG